MSESRHARKCLNHAWAQSLRGWLFEILALMFSTACLLTISILLVVYHGQSIQSFPQGITLNAIVSVLSTTFKAALIYPVSTALGQAKWNWYADQERLLRDFQRIEEASRGPLGATRILFGPTSFSVASLGAIIVILALLVDPFAQQLLGVASSLRMIKSENVWTEVLTNPFDLFTSESSVFNMEQALYGAIWNNISIYDRRVRCPAANCTLNVFETLEWCTKTETIDVSRVTTNCTLHEYNSTDFVAINEHYTDTGEFIGENRTCGLFLDNNTTPLTTFSEGLWLGVDSSGSPMHYISYPYAFLTVDHGWSFFDNADEFLKCGSWLNISCPPLAFSYVQLQQMVGTIQWMEQSVLTLCATEYSAVVNSGNTTIALVASQYGRFMLKTTPTNQGHDNFWGLEDICLIQDYYSNTTQVFPNNNYTEGPRPGNTSLLPRCWSPSETNSDVLWYEGWLKYFEGIMFNNIEGEYITGFGDGTQDGGGDVYPVGSNIMDSLLERGLSGLSSTMAAAINNGWYALSQNNVTGSYMDSETLIQVRWEWLLLPVTLNVLGYIVLYSVIRTSKKTGQKQLWKSSTLASLYHGLDQTRITSVAETVTEMENAAGRVTVRLQLLDSQRRILLVSEDGNA
jgi:hypothetical protein